MKKCKKSKVDSIFSDLKTESKSAFIESLKAFQAQNPNFLSISLIRNCQESIGHMVLSPKGEDKYEMKYVPEDFDRYDQGFLEERNQNILLLRESVWKN